MCECSKRYRHGGAVAPLDAAATPVGRPAINGYTKHVIRHYKGRGQCVDGGAPTPTPPPPPTPTPTPTPAPARQRRPSACSEPEVGTLG